MKTEEILVKYGVWTKEEIDEMRKTARAIFIRNSGNSDEYDLEVLKNSIRSAMVFSGKYEDCLEAFEESRSLAVQEKFQAYEDLL